MPIRFMTNPLCCIISGGEDSTLAIAVMAKPCALVQRDNSGRRWTRDQLMKHLAAGKPCPPERESLARTCGRLGWLTRPAAGTWALTQAGRDYMGIE